MNRAFILPATFAVTMHAWVFFGLPGKTPPPAPPPPDPPLKEDPRPALLYEDLAPLPSEDEIGERRSRERHGVRRMGDVPVPGPAKGFSIPPLPPVMEHGTDMKIPVDWERPGEDLGRSHDNVVDLRNLDHEPRARVRPAPDYPYNLRAHGIEGTVWVEFLVDESGSVYHALVLRATTPGFEEAVLRAVTKWRFEPGLKKGRPVRYRVSIPVVFSLDRM